MTREFPYEPESIFEALTIIIFNLKKNLKLTETKYEITKCICSDVTFAEMKVIIDEHQLKNIDELREYADVAMNCKLCVPYIDKMFETGQTKFEIIIK